MLNRRKFQVKFLALFSATFITTAKAGLIDQNGQAAISLGFKLSSSSVDGSKFPKYAAWQACENCALFTLRSAGLGKCPLFAGSEVPEKGWCSAYAKRDGFVPVNQSTTTISPLRTQNQPQPDTTSTLTLGNAKEKCKEIGFTPSTEKFGNCVLQLTK